MSVSSGMEIRLQTQDQNLFPVIVFRKQVTAVHTFFNEKSVMMCQERFCFLVRIIKKRRIVRGAR